MGVILDTSVLVQAERQALKMGEWIKGREEETFGISVITVAELLHGVNRADSEKRRLTRSAFVEKVIEVFPIYSLDVPVVRIYAAVWADLSRKGTHIGAHDLMIGSTALALGFSVASFNARHFEKIEGLKIEIFPP